MRIKDLAKVALTTLVTVVVMVAVTAMQPDLGPFHVSEAFLDSLRRRDLALGAIAFACALTMLRVLALRTWLGILSAVISGVVFIVVVDIGEPEFPANFVADLPDFLMLYLAGGALVALVYFAGKAGIQGIRGPRS